MPTSRSAARSGSRWSASASPSSGAPWSPCWPCWWPSWCSACASTRRPSASAWTSARTASPPTRSEWHRAAGTGRGALPATTAVAPPGATARSPRAARAAAPAMRRGEPCSAFPSPMRAGGSACRRRRGAVQWGMSPDLRTLLPAVLCLLLAACAHAPQRSPLAQWTPSPNHDARRPSLVVLHATEQGSVAESLHTLRTRNSGGPVSAHYLVGADGTVHQLVDDRRRAWHAGGGSWGALTELNSASIGIELDNDGAAPFPPAQIEALLRLLEDLATRLGIPRHAVIAHADLAPTRKRDPGPRFPWHRLAEAGFGLWPDPADG